MSGLRQFRLLVAGNLVGLACMLGIVTMVPSIGAVVRLVRNPWERDDIVRVMLGHVKQTFVRDLPLSIALALSLAVGASTGVAALGQAQGGVRLGATTAWLVVYGVVGLLLAAYAHAAGTLPATASRREVMELAMGRLQTSPGRALLALLVVVLTLPLWLLAPVAVLCGISLPAWLHTRLWHEVDLDLLEFVEVDEELRGIA